MVNYNLFGINSTGMFAEEIVEMRQSFRRFHLILFSDFNACSFSTCDNDPVFMKSAWMD